MLRILEDQAIEYSVPPGRRKQRKGIVHPNRTLTAIQNFAKISLSMPAFGVRGGLEAVILDPPVPRIESLNSVGASVPTFAEPICDKKPFSCGGAHDHGPSFQFSHAFHGGRLAQSLGGRPPRTLHHPCDKNRAAAQDWINRTPDFSLVRIVTLSYDELRHNLQHHVENIRESTHRIVLPRITDRGAALITPSDTLPHGPIVAPVDLRKDVDGSRCPAVAGVSHLSVAGRTAHSSQSQPQARDDFLNRDASVPICAIGRRYDTELSMMGVVPRDATR